MGMKPFHMEEDLPDDPPVPKLNLTVELVPSSSWGDNLRSRMTQAQWDKVRKAQYAQANYQCEICGGKGTSQGYNWPVECHEVWQYDDQAHTQKLVRLISLCPQCHQVKHFGLAELRGRRNQAMSHMQKVNGWTREQAEQHVREAASTWRKRSRHPWTLDLSYLYERGIRIDG